MSAFMLLAGVLMAQPVGSVVIVEASTATSDVGYAELTQGRPQDAITRIQANPNLEHGDPAALINMGAAHARLGHADKARKFYLAAIASRDPADLELADGRWMDSRKAARLGVESLRRAEALAVR
jgi:hypothetical protein